MSKKNRILSNQEVEEIKQLVKFAKESGKSIRALAKENPQFEYKTIQYWENMLYPNPTKVQDFTRAKQMKRLLTKSHAKGMTLTDIHRANPKISMGTLRHWNIKFQIIPMRSNKINSEERIREMLLHVDSHGFTETEIKYNIDRAQLYEWNISRQLFVIMRKTKEYTEEEILAILNDAEKYNKTTYSRGGVKMVCGKYNISHTNVYEWNKTRKIIQTKRHSPDTLISSDGISEIIQQAKQFKTVKALSKIVGYGPITVKKILEMNGFICDRNGIRQNFSK